MFWDDLRPTTHISARAAERALARVGAASIAGFEGAVIFEPRMAKSLIAGFLGAINGAAIARGASFLKDAMGRQVFGPGIHIWDDPTIPRSPGARRIDAEGHRPDPLALVTDGVLNTWLLDRRTAALLGLKTNARAARGGGAISPSATNVVVSGGAHSQEELLGHVERGLFITDMMGQGTNPLTGAYSRGAGGFLIEKGRLTQPVQAMTVAGQMQDMFQAMVLGTDTDRDGSLHVPSILPPHMKIAGA